jgi:uncharacterized coiled-coil DUF342 family protein
MPPEVPFDSKADALIAAVQQLDAKIDGVHARLDNINGTVGRHEKAMNENLLEHKELFHTTGDLLKESNDRKIEERKKKEMFWERVLWFVAAVLLAYVIKNLNL